MQPARFEASVPELRARVECRPGYREWAAVYVPAGVAHGFQSLRDRTEVLCQASAAAVQGATRRVSPDDPLVVRSWPLPVSLPA